MSQPETEDSYGTKKRLKFIAKLVQQSNPKRVLDVGCGVGNVSIPLAKVFPQVEFLGIDADKASIEFASTQSNAANLEFHHQGALRDDEKFDLIIASEVIEHVEDPERFLLGLKKRLTRGGKMILTLPNGYGPFEVGSFVETVLYLSGILRLLRKVRPPRRSGRSNHAIGEIDTLAVSPHINFFTFKQIKRLVAKVGLEVIGYRPRTLLCGFGFDQLLRGQRMLAWNARISDSLPPFLSSDWMFALVVGQSLGGTGYRRNTYARIRRRLNEKRLATRTRVEARVETDHLTSTKTFLVSPHILWCKVKRVLLRQFASIVGRFRDRRQVTYCEDPPGRSLLGHLQAFESVWLMPMASQIKLLAKNTCKHRFDILGSGWSELSYGMDCRGLAGYRYEMSKAVEADNEGYWLAGRVNAANLPESRKIWRLVGNDYSPIDWQLDFKSGYRWAEGTWYRDVRIGEVLGADIKVPWELARMHHLPQLAWAYALAREGVPGFEESHIYMDEFRNQILDFVSTNPPRFGANWTSTMDVAIRIVNWLVAHDIFRAKGARFDKAFATYFSRSVYEHGQHITSNLEWFEELHGNHYLANIVGLIFVAAYLPRSPEIDAWLAFGVQELVKEVGYQFTSDGANFEASTSYHRLSTEIVIYATGLVLGLKSDKQRALREYDYRRHKTRPRLWPGPLPLYAIPGYEEQLSPFPASYFERMEKMAEFTMHVTKPNGRVVQIGDNDSGRFLKLVPAFRQTTVAQARSRYENLQTYDELADNDPYLVEDSLNHHHLVAAMNGLFAREDFAEFAAGADAETQFVEGLAEATRVRSHRRPGVACAAARVRIGSERNVRQILNDFETVPDWGKWVIDIPVDGGSLLEALYTYGYPEFGLYIYRSCRLYLAVRCGSMGQTKGAHAHNDQLSIELNIDGEEWITDPGTYLYSALPAVRNQYRSVDAHFAPKVNETEPGRLDRGMFRLDDEAQAQCLYFGSEAFIGTHYGYGQPVYRSIELHANSIVIRDWTRAGVLQDEDYTSRPLFSPGYGVREIQEPKCL